MTNLQGDVTAIVNLSGSIEAIYNYDAFGKITSMTYTTVSQTNPLRYRGYYFDSETGFYYLQSRYYDPEICRFINADGYASTGQGFIGTNMFAYCNNNPVSANDDTGNMMVDATKQFPSDSVATSFYKANRNDVSYCFGDFLYDALGPSQYDISFVGGFCIMAEIAASLVIDDNKSVALVITPGIGGGFGMSAGVGKTTNERPMDISEMRGPSGKIGASLIFLGMEADDKSSYSVSLWKPSLGGDFHSTINYSWVIVLWRGQS